MAHLLIEIAEERDLDFFLNGPGFLGKGGVNAEAIDGCVHLFISGETRRNFTHLFRANAGEGEGKEKEDSLFLAEVSGQFDVLKIFAPFGFKGEVGGFATGR